MGGGIGRARRIAVWTVLAAALAAALAFVVVRIALPADGARVAFYDAAPSADGVLISPIDEPAAGLAAGDTVTAVGGRPLEGWLADATNPAVARPTAGEALTYDFIRNGEAASADITWMRPAIGATLLEGWSVIVLSVVTASVAAFVFARRPDEPAAVPLVLVAAGLAGSSVPWFLGTTVSDIVQGTPFLLHALVTGPLYMLMWPAAVHLALVFPAPVPLVLRRPWLVPMAYVIGLCGYGLAMLVGRLVAPSAIDWLGTWPLAQLAIVVPLLSGALALLAWSFVRTPDPAARIRIRWATLGGIASAAVGLALFWLPELVLRRPLVDHSWIGVAALPFPLGLAAAILRDRLFDIDVVVRRALVYGGLTVGVLASYVVAAAAMGSVAGPEHGYGVSLLATGIAALIALPLRDVLQRSVNRLMYGERDEPWRAIRRLGQRLEWTAEPGLAFPAIAETVADSLRLPFVALELAPGAERWQEGGRHESDGSPPGAERSSVTGPGTVVAEHGERRGPTVVVPLVHGGEPMGRLVLGVRAGEQGFRADELALLDDLARQAGLTIHAMRLRADLLRSREALVLAREEERRRLRRDLHDGLGPSLAAIGLRAEASAATLDRDPEGARRLLDELGDDVRIALADIRRLVDGLRPPALDELGLLGAIEQQMRRLEGGAAGNVGAPGATGATVGGTADDADGRTDDGAEPRRPNGPTLLLEVAPLPLPDLPAAVEVAAYRITVEAVTNVVRHAAATSCRVRVGAADELTVEITDDGRGIAPNAVHGIGLESIRARAEELGGTCQLEQAPGGGTRIVARLPIMTAGRDSA